MDETSGELLTAREVATRLRIKSSTLYQAVVDGRIPHIKLWQGRRKALIRFRAKDIEELLRQRSIPAK